MSNASERTQKIKDKIEGLGKYHVESGRIKADLDLKAKITILGAIDSGIDWYYANFNFYTDPQWRGDKKGFGVQINYSINTLNNIFKRIKRAEKGIESILADPGDDDWDVNSATDVIKCILSLEDQTQNIYKEREKAAQKRKNYVHGKNQD